MARYKGKSKKFDIGTPVSTSRISPRKSSNSDHLVKAASGLSVSTRVALKAASLARESLSDLDSLVEQSVSQSTSDMSLPEKGTTFTDSDLNSLQSTFIDSMMQDLDLDANSSDDSRRVIIAAVKNLLKNGATEQIKETPKINTNINKASPEIDYVGIETSSRGMTDRYSARIVFTFDSADMQSENVKAIRVFRSRKKTPETTRPLRVALSRHGEAKTRANSSRTRNKNHAKDGSYESMRLDQRGINNSLSSTTTLDEITGLRISSTRNNMPLERDPLEYTSSSDDKNLQAILSFLSLQSVSGIDTSVIKDLNSMKNIQLQNPAIITSYDSKHVSKDVMNVDSKMLSALGINHVDELRSNVSLMGVVTNNQSNSNNYKELAIVPISRLHSDKSIGTHKSSLIEFSYSDDTVELGNTYTYYVTSLDDMMIESLRSRIVKVTIEDVIPPSRPISVVVKQSGVSVVLSMLAHHLDDVEKFEIYRKTLGENKKQLPIENTRVISHSTGYVVDTHTFTSLNTGLIQVGESINSTFAGSTFIDRTTVQGKSYEYHIYTVDLHDNKTPKPKIVSIFLKGGTGRATDLRKPTLLAEIDSKTRKVKLTISSDDPRVKAIFLSRKNNTLKERAFTIPAQPDSNTSGAGNAYSSVPVSSPILQSTENMWSGMFLNDGNIIEFLDKTTRTDNTYQYRAHAVDRYGNLSSYEFTRPLFVSTRPILDTPINLVVLSQQSGEIILSWDDANLDISPEDRIGNREELENTAFRTLYQVDRKKRGMESWDSFQLTEYKSLNDHVSKSGEQAPSYRPPFLEVDTNYVYRVAVMQTGGFISNFSKEINVNTFLSVQRPGNVRINTCNSKCEPFFVTLNWSTPENTGTVKKWVIERAALNNFAAAKLNMVNVSAIEDLNFEHLSDVYHESSRSRSRSVELLDKVELTRPNRVGAQSRLNKASHGKSRNNVISKKNSVMSGDHYFIDSDIKFGNSYFYKISAVGLNDGNRSQPAIKGVRVTDSLFERKLNLVITQNEKNVLASSKTVLNVKTSSLRNHSNILIENVIDLKSKK